MHHLTELISAIATYEQFKNFNNRWDKHTICTLERGGHRWDKLTIWCNIGGKVRCRVAELPVPDETCSLIPWHSPALQ